MKKTIILLGALTLLSLSAQGQNDPRTRRIIESVLQTTAGDIGSTTSEAPEQPTKAKVITKTEGQQQTKEQRQSKPATAKPQPAAKDAAASGTTATAAASVRIEPKETRLPQPRIDTVYLSTLYTTHLIFDTDISYADLSNQRDIAGKVVDESKNKLALKARNPFSSTASVSVEEANGVFHTYILKYHKHPKFLIIDTRDGADMWALARLDTLNLSTLYTTHLIFSSDVTYADISQPSIIAGKLVDQGKNKLAIKAREQFNTTASLSVEEANGIFHTYILNNIEEPSSLVKDTRIDNKAVNGSITGTITQGVISGSNVRNSTSKSLSDGSTGVSSNNLKKADAPTLADVIKHKQKLFHLSTRKYDIRLTCENIYSYSDIIYLTFRLDNNSGISYEVSDANFVIESNNGTKRKLVQFENIFPKNRFGSLTTESKGTSKICYSFDKITLSSDQVLKVYLYEEKGQRNIALTILYKDINNATPPTE